MNKKDNKAAKIKAQLKNDLGILKKLGLYTPKAPRKAPTRYAKSLIKKYSDVIKGRSEVVKVPTSIASTLKGEFRVKRSNKGTIAIVPKAAGTKAKYSKKQNTIVRSVGDYEFTPYPDKYVFMRGEFPKLKRGQRIAIRIGNTFRVFKDHDELYSAMTSFMVGSGADNPNSATLWQYPYIVTRRK